MNHCMVISLGQSWVSKAMTRAGVMRHDYRYGGDVNSAENPCLIRSDDMASKIILYSHPLLSFGISDEPLDSRREILGSHGVRHGLDNFCKTDGSPVGERYNNCDGSESLVEMMGRREERTAVFCGGRRDALLLRLVFWVVWSDVRAGVQRLRGVVGLQSLLGRACRVWRGGHDYFRTARQELKLRGGMVGECSASRLEKEEAKQKRDVVRRARRRTVAAGKSHRTHDSGRPTKCSSRPRTTIMTTQKI